MALCALYATLCGPGVRYRRLRDNGTPDPDPRRPVSAPATVGAALRDGWALVAPLAPDLVVLDLDGCAVPRVLDALETAASAHGALMAYRAASGSPDSEHHAYAVPAASRGAFRRAVERLRDRYGADGGGHRRFNLQDRTADNPRSRGGKGLRLPCSPSLKQGGGMVWPLTADGLPVLSLEEAARMVRAAREAAGLPATPPAPAPAASVTGEQDTPAPSSRRERSGGYASDLRVPVPVPSSPSPAMPSLSSWTASEQAALLIEVPAGLRSEAALPAHRAVVRHCGPAWTPSVRDLVMSAPAFAKFAADGEARARRWWEQTTGTYLEWLEAHGYPAPWTVTTRRAASDRDRAAVSAWLEAAPARLLEAYPVERAARALVGAWFIGQRRLLDGRGLEARPVAVRDLVVWGVCASAAGGSLVLRDLEAAGVLEAASDYDIAAPLEARRWSVPGGVTCERNEGLQGVSTPPLPGWLPALTGDGCAWLPPALRVVLWSVLSAPLDAAGLSAVLRCSARAVRGWLRRLEGAGLVVRSAAGVWSAGVEVEGLEAAAGAAAGAGEAVERLEAARDRVAVERAGWRDLWSSSVDAAGRLVWRFMHWRRPDGVRRRRRPAAPVEVAPGAVRDRVAVESGARDGWPDGGEAALFGLEALEDGRRRGCPARGGPVAARVG